MGWETGKKGDICISSRSKKQINKVMGIRREM
jgi:hypothetical protein